MKRDRQHHVQCYGVKLKTKKLLFLQTSPRKACQRILSGQQHNNPNAPDRREDICEPLGISAAGDWERYAAESWVVTQLN
jgi:hypothetical protein